MTEYKTKAIMPSDIQPAAQWQHHFAIKVDGATTVEDIVKPSFWVHAARNLEPFSLIAVLPRNQSYYAELLVTKVLTTNTGVKIPSFMVLKHVALTDAPAVVSDKPADKEPVFSSAHYRVEWKGSVAKHCIVRNEDRVLVEDKISTKADAIKRVEELEAA